MYRSFFIMVCFASILSFSILSLAGSIFEASSSASLGDEDSEFLDNFYSIVNQTNQVTQDYHAEIGMWQTGEFGDQEMISITNSYLSMYEQLINTATSFDVPEKFQNALDLYVKSLSSEHESYSLFRDFLATGDPSLNETSIDLLTNATEYELESFALIYEETAPLQ